MIAEVVLSSSIALAESLPSSTDDISVQDPNIHNIFQDISFLTWPSTCGGPLPPDSGTGVRNITRGRGHAPGTGGRGLLFPEIPSARRCLVSSVTR